MQTQRTFSPVISTANSFDFLRLLFALSVFIAHFSELTGYFICWPISPTMAIGGFFIISGFLITRSYYNSTFTSYLLKRAKRIVPAYIVVVLLCFVGLSLLSTNSILDYFTNRSSYSYLLANISFLNFLQPTLPGVFADNIHPYVNGALWTIKVELSLYLFVPLLVYLLKKGKSQVLLPVLYILSAVFIAAMVYLYKQTGADIYLVYSRQFVGQGMYFVAGVILLFYIDFFLQYKSWSIILSFALVVLSHLITSSLLDFFEPIAFAVLIVLLAYQLPKLKIVSKYGDISYGLYLFHYPVIQVFVAMGWFEDEPVILFFSSLLCVVFCAYASWHGVEKWFLKRR